MKILLRTLIILLAAAVVTGATMGALQVPAVQSWIGSAQGGERHGPPAGMAEGQFPGAPAFTKEATANATAVQGTGVTVATASADSATGAAASTTTNVPARPMRGEGGRPGGNLQGLVEVGKNLSIVVAVSLAIAAVGWVGKRFRPHRPASAAA